MKKHIPAPNPADSRSEILYSVGEKPLEHGMLSELLLILVVIHPYYATRAQAIWRAL